MAGAIVVHRSRVPRTNSTRRRGTGWRAAVRAESRLSDIDCRKRRLTPDMRRLRASTMNAKIHAPRAHLRGPSRDDDFVQEIPLDDSAVPQRDEPLHVVEKP